eukprot:TRINITY_DN7839_c0_g1_i1.p1 TRINITY_DN7839_c0_g1~~TRINITY_DN7839_c0_g1_i1.p1  ORF type:complete len:107 (+),score=20.34 TRINITY_DN7839_c0_g1_i1:155-475(+)
MNETQLLSQRLGINSSHIRDIINEELAKQYKQKPSMPSLLHSSSSLALTGDCRVNKSRTNSQKHPLTKSQQFSQLLLSDDDVKDVEHNTRAFDELHEYFDQMDYKE